MYYTDDRTEKAGMHLAYSLFYLFLFCWLRRSTGTGCDVFFIFLPAFWTDPDSSRLHILTVITFVLCQNGFCNLFLSPFFCQFFPLLLFNQIHSHIHHHRRRIYTQWFRYKQMRNLIIQCCLCLVHVMRRSIQVSFSIGFGGFAFIFAIVAINDKTTNTAITIKIIIPSDIISPLSFFR